MEEKLLLTQFHKLSSNLQEEVLDFIAFLLQKEKEKKPAENGNYSSRKAGSLKGVILYMAEDFNAPIDDFQDYI